MIKIDLQIDTQRDGTEWQGRQKEKKKSQQNERNKLHQSTEERKKIE